MLLVDFNVLRKSSHGAAQTRSSHSTSLAAGFLLGGPCGFFPKDLLQGVEKYWDTTLILDSFDSEPHRKFVHAAMQANINTITTTDAAHEVIRKLIICLREDHTNFAA